VFTAYAVFFSYSLTLATLAFARVFTAINASTLAFLDCFTAYPFTHAHTVVAIYALATTRSIAIVAPAFALIGMLTACAVALT